MQAKHLTIALLAAGSVLLGACSSTADAPSCDNAQCAQPKDYCDGDVAVKYTGPATCNQDTGYCENVDNEVRTDCAAQNGTCDPATVTCTTQTDLCDGVTCDTPPADECDTDGKLVTYAATGTCDSGTGDCSYEATTAACEAGKVCQDGACAAEPECTQDGDCTAIPADACDADGNVVTYGATCDAGTCTYPANTPTACDAGQVCTAGSCETATQCTQASECTEIPASECDADGNLVTYGNVCDTNGTCTYPANAAVACDAGQICEAGACRALTTAEEIDAVNANMGGTGLALPVAGAVVTLIQPNVNNDAGFFVQAGPTGPAMFVKVDPSTLAPIPAVGDTVSFTVTDVYKYPPTEATAITDFAVGADTTDVSGWPQNVNDVDVVTNRADYEAELVTFDATLSGDVRSGGTGYLQAQMNTAAVVDNGNLTFRAPTDVMNALDLENGCAISVSKAVVWAYSATAELTAFTADDITVNSCPAPVMTSAHAVDATTVEVTFSRSIDAASVTTDGSQFGIDNGLGVTAASVAGNVVTLTTASQTAGTTYTITVAGTVTDTLGTSTDTTTTVTFDGFGTPVTTVVPNGDFEQWTSGTPPAPVNWTADTGLIVEQEATQVHGGSYSLKLTRDTTNNSDTDFQSDSVPVVEGTSYTLAAWFYDNDPDARGRLTYQWFDSSNAQIGSNGYGADYTADGTAWQQLSETQTAPAGATFVKIGFRVYAPSGSSYAGGIVYVDDATVTAN